MLKRTTGKPKHLFVLNRVFEVVGHPEERCVAHLCPMLYSNAPVVIRVFRCLGRIQTWTVRVELVRGGVWGIFVVVLGGQEQKAKTRSAEALVQAEAKQLRLPLSQADIVGGHRKCSMNALCWCHVGVAGRIEYPCSVTWNRSQGDG